MLGSIEIGNQKFTCSDIDKNFDRALGCLLKLPTPSISSSYDSPIDPNKSLIILQREKAYLDTVHPANPLCQASCRL